jgi:hypothetical protein
MDANGNLTIPSFHARTLLVVNVTIIAEQIQPKLGEIISLREIGKSNWIRVSAVVFRLNK